MNLSYILIAFSIFSMTAYGSSIKVEPEKEERIKKSKVNFRASFSTSFNTDFKQFGDINKSFTNSSGLRFSLSFPGNWSLATALFFDKSFMGERKGEVRDTFLALTKPIVKFNDYFGLTAKLNWYLPISKFSREEAYLTTAYRLALILGFDFGFWSIPNLGGYARIDILQNFHRSNTNAYGGSNYQFAVFGLGGVNWTFLKKFNIALDFSYTKRWTYAGNIQDFYSSNQTLSYSITSKFNVGIGHALGGNILAVNGRDSNVALFDPEQSAAFLVFSFVL